MRKTSKSAQTMFLDRMFATASKTLSWKLMVKRELKVLPISFFFCKIYCRALRFKLMWDYFLNYYIFLIFFLFNLTFKIIIKKIWFSFQRPIFIWQNDRPFAGAEERSSVDQDGNSVFVRTALLLRQRQARFVLINTGKTRTLVINQNVYLVQ